MKLTSMFSRARRGAIAVVTLSLLMAPIGHASAPAGRYTIASGSVTDIQTGLIWQQAVDGNTYNYATAKQYCAGLTGGTWRLPSPKELQTLVDESRVSPAIDTTAFPNTPATYFWSSESPRVVAFDAGDSGTVGASDLYRVRCVR